MNKDAADRFHENPEHVIEDAIKAFVRESGANRLKSFGDASIFEEPLVGFAAGDDPLFDEFKKVVHAEHFTPREILTKHLRETLATEDAVPEDISVVSIVLPTHPDTLRSNALEKEGPSLRWNHTRWLGQEFIDALSRHLTGFMESLGVPAVAPGISPFFKIMTVPDGFTSNWSQRHIAYAAGLGTFSLNEGFITKRGMAMRLGSFVAGIRLAPSARPYEHYRANCLFYRGIKCGRCIARCPGGALSEKGHDKIKCFKVLYEMQAPWLKGEHGPGYIGQYAGCGLCQTGVPCQSRIPQKSE